MRKIIKWICLLIWIVFIFLMSNQSGEISSDTSFFFVRLITNHFYELSSKIEMVTFFIRKLAHILEYLILGILVYSVVEEYSIQKKILVSLLLCIWLSCMDELHQIFISGRNGNIFDVLIDMSGYMIAILFLNRIEKRKYKSVYQINSNE